MADEVRVNVTLKGGRSAMNVSAIADSGAVMSMLPTSVAVEIGAYRTNHMQDFVGVFAEPQTLHVVLADLKFPELGIEGRFPFAVNPERSDVLLGMKSMSPLGIIIDTGTGKLKKESKGWEAFKTIGAVGFWSILGIAALNAMFGEPNE